MRGSAAVRRLTDMFGRKRLFMITLGVYLVATIATAFAPTALFFFVCRFVTGMGSAVSTPPSTPRSMS